jgi:tetratricopeptide (TPR) repeat protein
MGKAKEAEVVFTRALESPSASPRTYLMRARARRAQGDTEGGAADVAEGLRREPDNEIAWAARAKARSDERKDHQGALADLDECLKRFPRSFLALQNKAAVLSEQLGKPDEAIRILDALLEFYPDQAIARGARGVLHARLGRREAALADSSFAMSLSPRPETAYYAACARSLTSRQNPGDAEDALRLLRSAVEGGFGLAYIDKDPDLDPIRRHPAVLRIGRDGRAGRSRDSLAGPASLPPLPTDHGSG